MQSLQQLYVELLKKSLLNSANRDVSMEVLDPPSLDVLLQPAWFDHFWSGDALTMCSPTHLENTRFCVEDCLARASPAILSNAASGVAV